MAPFLAIQLIQRFVTSNPSPRYVGVVTGAFKYGKFDQVLPDAKTINEDSSGRKGKVGETIPYDNDQVRQKTKDYRSRSGGLGS